MKKKPLPSLVVTSISHIGAWMSELLRWGSGRGSSEAASAGAASGAFTPRLKKQSWRLACLAILHLDVFSRYS